MEAAVVRGEVAYVDRARVKTQLTMLRFNGLVNRIRGPTDAGELFWFSDDKDRNIIERRYCRLKDFRRIATRYDKLGRNYFSALCLVAAVAFWL